MKNRVRVFILIKNEIRSDSFNYVSSQENLLGKPIYLYVADTIKRIGIYDITILHENEISDTLKNDDFNYININSEDTKINMLDKWGASLIINGNLPMISGYSLEYLIENHFKSNLTATGFFTSHSFRNDFENQEVLSDVFIIKNRVFEKNKFLDVLKEALKYIREPSDSLLNNILDIIDINNNQVNLIKNNLENDLIEISNKKNLSKAIHFFREEINNKHMDNGIIIFDSNSTFIDDDVEIGYNTIIYPNNIINNKSKIGNNCTLMANNRITNSIISDNVCIEQSVIIDSEIGSYTTVGPFAYIRPDSKIGDNVKIGDFVEIKNSNLGDNTKVSHLTYIGDANVGKNINFGCGTVTVNYDGSNKFRTIIEDNAFIGCNSNLVAPVKIEENSYIAAGSTITDDVPKNSLSIARSRQVNKENWEKP